MVKFYDRPDVPNRLRHLPNQSAAYAIAPPADKLAAVTLWKWWHSCRPFYNLYPVLFKPFLKTDLSKVKVNQVVVPEDTICIRMPEGHPYRWIIVTIIEYYGEGGTHITNQLHLVVGENATGHRQEVYFFCDDRDLETAIENMDFNEQLGAACEPANKAMMKDAMKIAVATCLLGQGDTSVITRAEGAAMGWDIGKYFQYLHDQHKEGKQLGAQAPRYCPPYFAIRHMGKCGTRPVLRPVKGYYTHKDELTDVPTGFIIDPV